MRSFFSFILLSVFLSCAHKELVVLSNVPEPLGKTLSSSMSEALDHPLSYKKQPFFWKNLKGHDEAKGDLLLVKDARFLFYPKSNNVLIPFAEPEIPKDIQPNLSSKQVDTRRYWVAPFLYTKAIFYLKNKRDLPEVLSEEKLFTALRSGRTCIKLAEVGEEHWFIMTMIERFGTAKTTQFLTRLKAANPEIVQSRVKGFEALKKKNCEFLLLNSYSMNMVPEDLRERINFSVISLGAKNEILTNGIFIGKLHNSQNSESVNAIISKSFWKEVDRPVAFFETTGLIPSNFNADWTLYRPDYESLHLKEQDASRLMLGKGWY